MANQQAGDMQSEAGENRSMARNTLPHVLVLCGSVIYPIVFLPLYRMIGATAFAFSFPVSAFAGWLWGVRGGVFFAVVLSFINVGLGIALGVEVFESVVNALAGLVVMLLIGGIVGRLRESTDRTRQEIAERRRAEETLRESEERYRTLADAAHDMIFIINRDGNVEYVNIFAASIFNRRPEELIGKPLGALFPTDTLERQRRSLRGVIETLEPYYAEQLTSFPERDLWLGTWLVPLKNEAGQARAVLGISRDITERRRTEEAEREQRMLAEALRDTAAALNSSLNFDEILERVLANVDRVVPHDTADIMLIESGVAHIARSRGYSERGEDHLVGLRFTVADVPNLRRMAETGQPVVIADAHADPQWVVFPETRWIRSYVGAPIRVKEQVIGFLNLDSATPGFFTTAHAERLQAFADQAATALDNARLLAESRQRLRVLEALQQASLAFTQLLRPEAVGLNIIETVERLLGYRRSSV